MAGEPWGASEELWSQAALTFVKQGFSVNASVEHWSPLHHRVQALLHGGVNLHVRTPKQSLWARGWRRLRWSNVLMGDLQKLISEKSLDLVVISDGGAMSPVEVLEACLAKDVPFVTVSQCNSEGWWPEDASAERYRQALSAALRCYFASTSNLRLFEKQIGCDLFNARIVCNPINVECSALPPWPINGDHEVLFACVGRLHPPSKGQDILLQALASSVWANRKWQLRLYGEGRYKNSIERLVQRFHLMDRVSFGGYARVEDIWSSNHVLVMPSRYEGLPLAMIEAMSCARPVIATNVAGHLEIIEDGVNGFLAEAPTVQAMSTALERFWQRRAEMDQMGRRSRERIHQIMPSDPVAKFVSEIKDLIASRY